MFAAIGRFAVRFRWIVIVAWLVVAAVGVVVMPRASEFSMSTGFLAHGVESVNARHLMNEKFPEEQGTASTALLVLENPAGLAAADEDYARRVIREVPGYDASGNVVAATSVFDRPELRPNLVSADETTLLIPVGVASEAFAAETGDSVQAIRENLPPPPAGTRILVSGDAGLGGDHAQACLDAVAATTIATLALIALILLLVYRSPIAPFVPLAAIGVSAAVSLGIVGLLMSAGWTFSSFLQQFVIVIVFGAGTDYCLFILSRYREELQRGHAPHDAVVRVMSLVGAVIASSAAIVVVGFLAFAFAEFEMFRTIGPGLALSVAVMLVVGLTLVPALMAAASPGLLFWPVGPKALSAAAITATETRSPWGRLGRLVAAAPARVLLVGLVVLLVPALYLPSLRQTFEA
jgi:RND superfamily putative drug exporter